MLGELSREVERLIEVAANLKNLRAVDDRLGQFAERDLALGDEDHALHVGLGRVRGRRGGRVARRATDHGLRALRLRLGDRHGHATILKRSRGVEPLVLQPDVRFESLRESIGVKKRRVSLLQGDDVINAFEIEPLGVLVKKSPPPDHSNTPSMTRIHAPTDSTEAEAFSSLTVAKTSELKARCVRNERRASSPKPDWSMDRMETS